MSDVKRHQPVELKPTVNEAGFTLIELLVTMVVLGIVITSLAALFYTMQVTQVQSQRYDLAVRAARTEIEDLRNSGYDTLSPGTNIDFTSSLPSGLPAGKNGTVVVSQPTADLRRVDVTITYTDYGIAKTVTLSSDIGIIGLRQG